MKTPSGRSSMLARKVRFVRLGPSALGMQPLVHHGCSDHAGIRGRKVPGRPGIAKGQEPGASTFGAGSMAGGEGRRFIEEEELGVAVRGHDRPMPTPELEHADEPSLDLPRPKDVSRGIVENAPIAHHRPLLRRGDDLAERRDPILSWHERPSRLYRDAESPRERTRGIPIVIVPISRTDPCQN